jgi:hypothetical protein
LDRFVRVGVADEVPVVVAAPVVVDVAAVVDVPVVVDVLVLVAVPVVDDVACTCFTACPRLRPSTVMACCRSANETCRFLDTSRAAIN